MAELRIMGTTETLRRELNTLIPNRTIRGGDTKLIWNAANEDETEAARRTFTHLRGKGFNAYAVKKDGEAGEQITEFDSEAGKIIMAPAMAGG